MAGWNGSGKSAVIDSLLQQNRNLKLLVDDGVSDPRDLLMNRVREVDPSDFDSALEFIFESHAAIEPLDLVAHFSNSSERPESSLLEVEIKAIVTVVDATTLNSRLNSPTLLFDLKMNVDEFDDYTDADVVVDQIEFADCIVLTRAGELESDLRARARSTVEWLAPRATVLESPWPLSPDFIDHLQSAIDDSSFDEAAASVGTGWMQIISGSHPKIDRGAGISGFSFRARRPFHPSRFKDFLERLQNENVLRARGLIWIATRNSEAGDWMQAGSGSLIASAGAWWAATPMREWPDDPIEKEDIMSDWLAPYGDRRQEFSLIGIQLKELELRRELKNCLLTDSEFHAGPESWAQLEDPLPDWSQADETVDDDSYLN